MRNSEGKKKKVLSSLSIFKLLGRDKENEERKGIHSTNPVLSSHFYGICRFPGKDAFSP